MNTKIFKNKNFLSVFLALIVFVIIFSLNFDLLNKNLQKYFTPSDKEITTDDRIVIIKIDEKTVKKLGRFPFDRKIYTKLIHNLNKAGATVIGLDIIFADKTSSGSDNEFASSIKQAGNIVLGGGKVQEGQLFENPLQIFVDGSISLGVFNVTPDPSNNTVFSVIPNQKLKNGSYDYFGISLLRGYYSILFDDKSYLTEKLNFNKNYFSLKENIKIPLASKNTNNVLINFKTSDTFKEYSFINIYNDEKYLNKDSLKDKIVLVGSTLRGIDILNTPVGEKYGVYVHANFLNTVLTKNFLKYFDKKLELLLIFLITILAIYLNLNKSGKILIINNVAIIGIIFVYFTILGSIKLISYFPFELILAILLSSILSNITKYIIENKDKNKLNTALSEYVSKDIAEEILSGDGNINLEGEKKRISIFFSDIEGFTTISEKFDPEKLISFLKQYLTEMSEIIMINKGFINKYEGDAIMVLWGVFGKNVENISKKACKTALTQKQKLVELNTKWGKKGIPLIKIRIGINVGDAIIGNIGAIGKKLEFTAIGDNVNLASRLESINKFYGTYICVSENIYQDTKDIFEFRYLDKIKVKGKYIAINIYELLDYKGNLNESAKNIYDDFQKGINLYLDKKFKEALKIFDKLIELGDKPSLVYIDRCKIFIETPPPKNWDQTWTMSEK